MGGHRRAATRLGATVIFRNGPATVRVNDSGHFMCYHHPARTRHIGSHNRQRPDQEAEINVS
jgi:hypothetical protein